METQKEKTVYIPVEKVNVTNEQLERLRKVKEILEDTFDELLDIYDVYEDFRELDIMTQKVEEAILWSHRVIAKEAQREALERLSEENTTDCEKPKCCGDKDNCTKNEKVNFLDKLIDLAEKSKDKKDLTDKNVNVDKRIVFIY